MNLGGQGWTSRWLLLAALGLPSLARAEEPVPVEVDPSDRPPLQTATPEPAPPDEPPLYDGNHIGLLGGLQVTQLGRDVPGLDRGGLGGYLAGRFSTVTQFLDLEAGLGYASHGGPTGSLSRTDLAVQAAVHPGFPLLVFNSWWYDVLSGLHGHLGATVTRGHLQGQAPVAAAFSPGDDLVDWSAGVYVGGGADIPVSPRNRPWGLWLTLRYNLRWLTLGETHPGLKAHDSQVLVLLGYRNYSNSWARIAPLIGDRYDQQAPPPRVPAAREGKN